jgi:hypothetical protein
MGPTKNINRDRVSPIEQLDDARHFKKPKRHQLDDDDDDDDDDLMKQILTKWRIEMHCTNCLSLVLVII